jgi:hypothetical protein
MPSRSRIGRGKSVGPSELDARQNSLAAGMWCASPSHAAGLVTYYLFRYQRRIDELASRDISPGPTRRFSCVIGNEPTPPLDSQVSARW